MALPQKLPYELHQTAWATQLNPLIAFAPTQGLLLKSIHLNNGVTVVDHKLGKVLQGWIVIDKDANANIYRSAALNNLTLTLTSDAATNVSLWVF